MISFSTNITYSNYLIKQVKNISHMKGSISYQLVLYVEKENHQTLPAKNLCHLSVKKKYNQTEQEYSIKTT